MLDVSARPSATGNDRNEHIVTPRVIAPHVPSARDIVSLYATRVEQSGTDVLPALRQRRASFPTTSEPVIGYLAASVPRVANPAPVGRGTATHRQALDALTASQWAAQVGWLPEPERVRVTRNAGTIGRSRSVDGHSARPGLISRLTAAFSAFSRPDAVPAAPAFETRHRLETQTA